MDVFPVFQVSQEADGYFPDTFPVTSSDARSIPSSPVTPPPSSLLNEATGSFDSIVESPVTSLSITDYAAEPLIPLRNELLLLPMPVPMWPQPSPGYCELGDTGGHLLISTGLPGCPYRMTTYREEDFAHVEPIFGVQFHHPRFLECIGHPSRPGCWVVPRPNGFM